MRSMSWGCLIVCPGGEVKRNIHEKPVLGGV